MRLATLKALNDYDSPPYRIKQCTDKLPEDRKIVNTAKLCN